MHNVTGRRRCIIHTGYWLRYNAGRSVITTLSIAALSLSINAAVLLSLSLSLCLKYFNSPPLLLFFSSLAGQKTSLRSGRPR